MIGIIAAVSSNGVIGIDNKLPFDYPADMKHFRTTTANSVVIMGRKTFESIGRPLPKRRNIIISRIASGLGAVPFNSKGELDGVEVAKSISTAIEMCSTENRNIWLIGGASIYEEGMEFADQIILTLTPDIIKADNAVRFPWINPSKFIQSMAVRSLVPEDESCLLKLATYIRV